jgi:hypothetical protein
MKLSAISHQLEDDTSGEVRSARLKLHPFGAGRQ